MAKKPKTRQTHEFEWDKGNLKHIISDHPLRGNTVREVESILNNPDTYIEFDRIDPATSEVRFFAVGPGTGGVIKYVVFIERNGKIRPITCFRAKPKLKTLYYENLSTASKGEGTASEEAGKAETSGSD